MVFNSDILIVVKNPGRLFSFLNTKKSSRKNFTDVSINLEYDFLSDQIKFNKIKIDNNELSDQFLNTAQELKGINFNNLFKTKRFINKLLNDYEG